MTTDQNQTRELRYYALPIVAQGNTLTIVVDEVNFYLIKIFDNLSRNVLQPNEVVEILEEYFLGMELEWNDEVKREMFEAVEEVERMKRDGELQHFENYFDFDNAQEVPAEEAALMAMTSMPEIEEEDNGTPAQKGPKYDA